MDIYNKEYVNKRTLPGLEVLSKDDIILDAKAAFTISSLKHFFDSHEVKVADEEEEEIGDETDVLKVSKVTDNGKEKVQLYSNLDERRLQLQLRS